MANVVRYGHPLALVAQVIVTMMLVGACKTSTSSLQAELPRRSTLKFSSNDSTCRPDGCACHVQGNEEEDVPLGKKCFEFSLASTTAETWVEVGGLGVFYKPANQIGDRCFRIDLKEGEYPVRLRSLKSTSSIGMTSALRVYEYGFVDGPNWYRSFEFQCGVGASACTEDELNTWAQNQRELPRGVLDPCGSVMAKKVQHRFVRQEKGDERLRQVDVSFALKVYKFKPYKPKGSTNCKAPTKNR